MVYSLLLLLPLLHVCFGIWLLKTYYADSPPGLSTLPKSLSSKISLFPNPPKHDTRSPLGERYPLGKIHIKWENIDSQPYSSYGSFSSYNDKKKSGHLIHLIPCLPISFSKGTSFLCELLGGVYAYLSTYILFFLRT